MIVGRLGTCLGGRLHGSDRESAGKIGAERGEEKELAMGLNACLGGEVFAQMSLGQQVREECRQASCYRSGWDDQSPRLAFE